MQFSCVIALGLCILDLFSFHLGLPMLVEDKPHPLDENIRSVERGSRIVVAVTQDTKVVLQVCVFKEFRLSQNNSLRSNLSG